MQSADVEYTYVPLEPAFAKSRGPAVFIDEAHCNFHTACGRYMPFARLLAEDGFVVTPLSASVSAQTLENCRVLVIANALSPPNLNNWRTPTPSAFSQEEIETLFEWVIGGGSLFLIADHMPFAGAAAALAAKFSFTFYNGFATDASAANADLVFTRRDGSLCDHAITQGRSPAQTIDKVVAFTGQAFAANGDAMPLLALPDDGLVFLPERAWKFPRQTPYHSTKGLLQGAAALAGQGKLAIFGEAAMFSAQVRGAPRTKMGMNAPGAEQNAQFLLNVMHWLVGLN